MMKYLKNDRGDFGVPFIACYILAMVILMVQLMTWVSAEVTCLCIRNTVKNELTNVSIRISEDTYRAMREGNLTQPSQKHLHRPHTTAGGSNPPSTRVHW